MGQAKEDLDIMKEMMAEMKMEMKMETLEERLVAAEKGVLRFSNPTNHLQRLSFRKCLHNIYQRTIQAFNDESGGRSTEKQLCSVQKE